MRTMLLVGLVTAGMGLAGISGASALPANGAAVIGDAGTATDHVTPVQWGHWRWGSSGGHWRWGSHGGHWRWGSFGHAFGRFDGHWRWGSRGGHWRWGSRGW